MGKLFDNSGKNTQNEIYDTSHRQYWNPPGQVAWKDNLPGFFGIILSIVLVMLFDCFVLHPIPAPEGTFSLYGSSPSFGLAYSGCEYADAKILSSYTASRGRELYLVEQDGEVHLIRFHESMLFTRKISDDVVISGSETQTVELGNFLSRTRVTIENGTKIGAVTGIGIESRGLTTIIYVVTGVAIAILGSVLLEKMKKIRK